jgi:hypothetical protein
MKTIKKIIGSGFLAVLLILALAPQTKAQGDYISDQDFYDNLQPYGTWISDSQYGNVWVPDVDGDFRPYATRGHWVVTDYGNTWVSDYPWGWATFHYGRWRYDDYYGWEWIPGHEWAPAWVSWRHGGGYYGWAPLLPGITIAISIGGGYRVPDNYWVCAPQAYINRPNIYNYYVPPSRSVTIIHNTTIINNTYVRNNITYVSGPRPQEIRQYTKQNVTVYNINNSNRPGNVTINKNTVNIYRPSVNKAPNARPARVVDASAYKQQHPNQPIANHAKGGAPTFNRTNATRLASAAKAPTPDSKIVRVNPVNNNRPNNTKPNNQPQQPAARPGQPNNAVSRPAQPANRPGQPNNAATRQAQPNNQPQQQKDARAQQQQQRQQQQLKTQQAQPQQKAVQQQEQQAQQKAAQQRQQQATQQQAQQKAAQQETQQRQQQQAAQQQAQQRQQQAQQQKAAQQQNQQRQQQQAAQQQAQQRQQQQAQQKAAQQQAQQRQQQAAQQQAQQRQQQKAQQQKAAQQQAQQRQQQQAAQQRAAQQKQQQEKQKPEPENHPK